MTNILKEIFTNLGAAIAKALAMIIAAIISIVIAFILYTIGVWSEKIQGELKLWHLFFFWSGFVFDTIGTTIMASMTNGFELTFHSITGALAIVLMLIHSTWATYVVIKNKREMKKKFHKFSIFVWIMWMIPFIVGIVMNK